MFDLLNYIPVIGSLLATLVPFVIVLSIVVAIHEYGHYIVGRWCGIHAEVFSLGFGPVLMTRTDKHGTRWQIAAVPLGGYVRFLGDADASSRPSAEPVDEAIKHKTLTGAKLYKRVLTVLAGPVANFVLSTVIFAGIIFYTGSVSNEPVVGKMAALPQTQTHAQDPAQLHAGDRILAINGQEVSKFTDIVRLSSDLDFATETIYLIEREGRDIEVSGPYLTPALVGWVMPVSPASKAGLKKGDVLLAVDSVEVRTFSQLVTAIKSSGEEAIDLQVWRDNKITTLKITPDYRDVQIGQSKFEKRMMIGVSSDFAFQPLHDDISIFSAANLGAKTTYNVVVSSLDGISQIISGQVGAENLQGPLGIAQMSGDTASKGLMSFIELIAFISTAIGFLNLLPIPVLDGGHLVIYAYEAVFRRPPSTKVIQIAMTMGLMLLLSLMMFATFNDVTRLF